MSKTKKTKEETITETQDEVITKTQEEARGGSINEQNAKSERLNKFIAANGLFSRRKIDEFILEGRVTVNGKEIFNLGTKINPNTDKVFIDGERVRVSDKKIYLMMNKPLNVITSVSDDKKRPTVIDILNTKVKIFPVGRLDFHTTGLLVLTNDGDFTNKLMNPDFKIWKTYDVKLSRPLDQKHRLLLEKGIKLEGVYTLPAIIAMPNEKDYSDVKISISQGKNRQVRRMFENFGYFVDKLHRSAYGNLQLGNLREGEFRKLTNEEVQNLVSKNSKIPQIIAQKEEPKKYLRGRKEEKVDKKGISPGDKRDEKAVDKKEGKINLTRGNKDIKVARKNAEKDSKKKDFKKSYDSDTAKLPREKKTREFKKSYSGDKATRDYQNSKSSYNKSLKKDYSRDDSKSYGKDDSEKFSKPYDDKKKSFSKDFKGGFKKDFKKDAVKSYSKDDSGKFSKPYGDKKKSFAKDFKSGFKKDFQKEDVKSYGKDDSRKFSKETEGSDYKKKSFSKDFKGGFKKDFKKDGEKSYAKKSGGSSGSKNYPKKSGGSSGAPKRSFGGSSSRGFKKR